MDNSISVSIDGKIVKVFFLIFIRRFPFDAKNERNNFPDSLIGGEVIAIYKPGNIISIDKFIL